MKKSIWIPGVSLSCALAGVAALLLRWRLLTTGVDDKGLLTAGQPLAMISWVLTGCVILLTVAFVWKHRNEKIAVHRSPVGTVARILAMAAAAVLFRDGTLLGSATSLAAAATAVVSVVELFQSKKRLSPAVAGIPTVLFFMLCMLSCYRVWSAEPEIQRYCYRLLALACLMMAAYQSSAISLGMGKSGLFLGAGFLGVYFAFAASADPGFTVLFLALGVWMFAQLGAVTEEE